MGFTSYGRAVKHNRYPGPRSSRSTSDESWRVGCLCSERCRLPVGFRSDSLSWKNWIGREPDFDRLLSFYTEHLPLRWAGPKRGKHPCSAPNTKLHVYPAKKAIMIANALPITDAVPFTAHIHGTADAPKRRSTICKPTRTISPVGRP